MVIVATMDQVVILSPAQTEEFIQKFNRTIEMGTLSPIKPFSSRPAGFLRGIFSDRLARITIPLGFALWFLLVVLVSILIPTQAQISMGYNAAGALLEAVPASRMLLLPVIAIFLYTISLLVGAYLFRKEDTRPISQMLWISGGLTSCLLLAAALVFFI